MGCGVHTAGGSRQLDIQHCSRGPSLFLPASWARRGEETVGSDGSGGGECGEQGELDRKATVRATSPHGVEATAQPSNLPGRGEASVAKLAHETEQIACWRKRS